MRRVLVALGASAAVVLLSAPAASAQAVTGPDSVACAEASRAVTPLVDASVLAAARLNDAQTVIAARLQANVNTARANLLSAQFALLNGVNLDPAGVAALVRAVVVADDALDVALGLTLEDATPSDLTDALISARVSLQTALDRRVVACTPPVVTPSTTPTTTPLPTTTVAPSTTPGTSAPSTTPPAAAPFADCDEVRAADRDPIFSTDPRFQRSLDSDGDGVGCEIAEDLPSSAGQGNDQVSVIPSDAPDTGGGPSWVLGF